MKGMRIVRKTEIHPQLSTLLSDHTIRLKICGCQLINLFEVYKQSSASL